MQTSAPASPAATQHSTGLSNLRQPGSQQASHNQARTKHTLQAASPVPASTDTPYHPLLPRAAVCGLADEPLPQQGPSPLLMGPPATS
jgi:hypothetical protein